MGQLLLSPRWINATVTLATLMLAITVGAVTAYSPLVGAGIGCAIAVGLLAIPLAHHADRVFLAALAILLGGYGFFGRGFAYLGVAPIYVGEIVLGLAAVALVFGLRRFLLTWPHALIIAFIAYGLARTIPFIPVYGIDALRDAAIWIYALFALAVSTLYRREHLERMVNVYRFLIPIFVIWVPISAASSIGWLAIPSPIGAFIYFKGGDMGVHLAGIGAFLLVGLYARKQPSLVTEAIVWPLWFVAVAMAGTINRGGLLSVVIALLAVFGLRVAHKWFSFFAVATALVIAALIVNPAVDIGQGKTLSIGQVTSNLVSVVAPSDDVPSRLAGTREWRIDWWSKIIDYTVHGPYFWTGKGFGINLGLSDRISIEEAVRSPHNGHMTVLARMGVPALLLWILLWTIFGVSLVKRIWAARRSGDTFVASTGAWLLALWLAMMTNASFDVYLEGPQGGIWFWSVVGVALALLRLTDPGDHRDDRPPETPGSVAALDSRTSVR